MEFLIAAMLLYLIYRVVLIDARITRLNHAPIRIVAPSNSGQEWQKPVENFDPKKPETLRPNQVRGRDIQGVENVIEFDVKINP